MKVYLWIPPFCELREAYLISGKRPSPYLFRLDLQIDFGLEKHHVNINLIRWSKSLKAVVEIERDIFEKIIYVYGILNKVYVWLHVKKMKIGFLKKKLINKYFFPQHYYYYNKQKLSIKKYRKKSKKKIKGVFH